MVRGLATLVLVLAGPTQAALGNAPSIEQDLHRTVYCSDDATVVIGNEYFFVYHSATNADVHEMKRSILPCWDMLDSHARNTCGPNAMNGLRYGWLNVASLHDVDYKKRETRFMYCFTATDK